MKKEISELGSKLVNWLQCKVNEDVSQRNIGEIKDFPTREVEWRIHWKDVGKKNSKIQFHEMMVEGQTLR